MQAELHEPIVVGECEHDACEKPLEVGQVVWKKGHDLYCSLRCMINDMRSPKGKGGEAFGSTGPFDKSAR
ncbi:hypothetical protein DFQ01_1443 [Paenibacillus cellulosilyticus]|uniref:Uncharacterized protein n=1 Tax=Paenibacillus cellulosilyticus TaxID=375489 RepID=A0A2V2YDV8_9BACL|nr:hypothetical protein DFQ01_1443 [Paenibacillus cellulosilyticus]